MNSGKTEIISVVIIEDEAHNSRMLCDITSRLRPGWKIESILESVQESVDWLREHPAPDLILMDIQLSDGTCFSIFEHVNLDSSRIIFTTAYDEYALRAFKVNSIDYLLKPIEEKELETAFSKFEHLSAENSSSRETYTQDKEYYQQLINSILNGKKEYRTRFLISGIKGYQKLETKDIAYIYSDNKLTFAVDLNSKEHTLDYNLEQLEAELEPSSFFRANRKIIVNIEAISELRNEHGGKLLVTTNPKTDFDITVSRLKAAEFKNWMGK